MKNYTTSLSDTQLRVTKNPTTGASSSTTSTRPLALAAVSSSGIVHGDGYNPNPWSYSVRRASGCSGYARRYYTPTLQREVYGMIGNVTLPTIPSFSAHLYNDLLDRLNEKVRGGIDLSVDAFQARQTARMFSAASQIESLAKAARSRGKGVLKVVGSLWLQWRYGWSPLLGTIHDAGEKLMNHTVKRLVFNVRGRERVKVERFIQPIDHIGLNAYIRPTKNEAWDMMEFKIKLAASNDALSSLAGWTSLNPASIAWELVPYSFVVDWFFDVGGYMRNFETALLYKSIFQSGYISRLQVLDDTFVYDGLVDQQFEPYVTAQMERSYSYRVFSRDRLLSYPLPRVPSFRCDLGSGRLLNAAALLSQRLK